jgi:hypothetical protein
MKPTRFQLRFSEVLIGGSIVAAISGCAIHLPS